MFNFDNVTEKFLRYVKIDTQSDDNSESFPSTEKQHNLAKLLAEELKQMGASDVAYDREHCYVYAKIPSNYEEHENHEEHGKPEKCGDGGERNLKGGIGFIAHMDTSPEMSGTNVRPNIVKNYDGGDILLGRDAGGKEYVLSPAVFSELKNYIGQDLITTDGNTLLGADDKAGVAEIMTMAEYLLKNPQIKHETVCIAFTPDEEVGRGTDYFNTEQFGAKYAYTVDGGGVGELEYENFNAAEARLEFMGQSVHPGEAKDKMINAARLAAEFDMRLPQQERPEKTCGYEGFYHLTQISGDVESAVSKYIIRDHDREKFEDKKEAVLSLADKMNKEYGRICVEAQIKDQYYNMKEKLKDAMFLVEDAARYMEELGITPEVCPIRGGTDGAKLSYMGIPCPNICTGGHNYHGRYEYCCIQSMEKISELLVRLAAGYKGNNKSDR